MQTTSDAGHPERTPASWADFSAAEPELAGRAERRLTAFTHHVLATLRRDGSPRTSGLEVRFLAGELWLGMMPGSLKARDLQRDPRFALQGNPGTDPDADMQDGDVRIAGRAVEVHDPEVIARYAGEVRPPEPFHLFRAELTEVVRTYVEGDELVVEVWRPDGTGLRTIRRR
ncbi:pyridoxamine 5'-phosphate oxidase family protein [Streptomyces triticagri]|uniref:Pyridoxamine 5'-phosphate oxidase family protein n=1 Tax=Streptomyces triticagri TaxID=2293568 RepID=A0A372M4Z6_9ACTN|nr:pyridoxamine 5'-phosphate oxidase family protein [Streptomyces triticagri]RFU86006.1 pyridoxamine 5'-phosphate oxidase family protein [Streptomyces triticagri]